MMKKFELHKKPSGVGYFINSIQTLFVGVLRVWTIPIVLMLSLASGFTTYYGLSHFITPWIALVITVAIQSIVVICSLEIAGMHWRANRIRYFSVVCSLLIALMASVSFSYFKFYEISQKDKLHVDRVNQLRMEIKAYIDSTLTLKASILKQQNADIEKASTEVSQAYFGTHPQAFDTYKNHVGEGPFWKHYNQIYLEKKSQKEKFERDFAELNQDIQRVQSSVNNLDNVKEVEGAYQQMLLDFENLQLKINMLFGNSGGPTVPQAPLLMTYNQFTAEVAPNIAMWSDFSLFAFICAAMVDFFTVLLSYRLEFTAPGPLTAQEEELVFACLRQFTEFRINKNDELEMVIEKTDIERARRYCDWSRMFAVGLLLNRGFLRKIDDRTVEFAPNLYPLIAEKMSDKIHQAKQQAQTATQIHPMENGNVS